ncbi:MAG: hypothetical protein N4A65_01970 [Cohaesibacter sp.]|jgi:hypothetical protein|nr:hypothetical protein [Cohaesibacter sp.]
MSHRNSLCPKEGPVFTITADDLSGAIGAAIQAADKHSGKQAGKKQIALNAAAKSLAGSRANWGALKAKDQVVSQAARLRHSLALADPQHRLDEAEYQSLPEDIIYEEFGLCRYDQDGEAELRRLFAPVFAKGVSVVSIPMRLMHSGSWSRSHPTWHLYGSPLFLDRAMEPVQVVTMYDRGLALTALEHVEKFQTDFNLRRLFNSFAEASLTCTMNVTQLGTIFIGYPSFRAFDAAFCEVGNNGRVYSNSFRSTYANIRAYLGPTNLDLDIDPQFKDCFDEGGHLPIYWFVDPKLRVGLPDGDLMRDLVFSIYSKFKWEEKGVRAPTAKNLLEHIAMKAQEPWQERFDIETFRSRHWERIEAKSEHHDEPEQSDQSGGLFSRISKLFS